MSLLWRDATKQDRTLLSGFRCTDPAPKEQGRRAAPHPRPWEPDVESAIHVLAPPLSGVDGRLLLGLDGGELVAVSLSCPLTEADGWHKIRLLAISVDRRTRESVSEGSAGEAALDCLGETLRRIDGDGAAQVLALIDIRNRASQRLVTEAGFAPISGFPAGDKNLTAWGARLR